MVAPHTFDVRPLVGIGPVSFGMGRNEVNLVLASLGGGAPRPRSERCDTFFRSAFQVNYDDQGTVEFIEMAAHDNSFRVVFEGVHLHGLDAEDAADAISRNATGRWEEGGHTFIVPALELSLWRGVLPEPDQELNDLSGRRFEAVGAGRVGYFSSEA